MSVWLAIPSARPNGGTIPMWVDRGYKVAVFLDRGNVGGDIVRTGEYPGYAKAVNSLVRTVLLADPYADWIVTGGDDVQPDLNHTAAEIAAQCSEHFSGETWGVMQPTGDRWANGSIDRICGSPWMGREFCARMYGGNGPLFEGYRHMFVDEELQAVAVNLGVLWQRPDLIHLHQHWLRPTWPRSQHADCPEFLKEANSIRHWNEFKAVFQSRQAAGFPGHEPSPVGNSVILKVENRVTGNSRKLAVTPVTQCARDAG